jgi:hypothetical protein
MTVQRTTIATGWHNFVSLAVITVMPLVGPSELDGDQSVLDGAG